MARIADAAIFTLVSEAAQECESTLQTKFKTPAAQHTLDAIVNEPIDRRGPTHSDYYRGGDKQGRGERKWSPFDECWICYQQDSYLLALPQKHHQQQPQQGQVP